MASFPKELAQNVSDNWHNIVGGDYVVPACPPYKILKTIFELCYLTASAPEEGRYPQFNVLVTRRGAPLDLPEGISCHAFSTPRTLSVSELRRLAPATDIKKSAIWVSWDEVTTEISGLIDLGTSWHRARLGLNYRYQVPQHLLVQMDRPGRMKVYQGQFSVATLSDGKIDSSGSGDHNLFLHPAANEGLEELAKNFSIPKYEHPRDFENFWFIALCNVFTSIANSVALSRHGGMLIVTPAKPDEVLALLRTKYPSNSTVLRDAFISFVNARNRTADFWEKLELKKATKQTAAALRAELLLQESHEQLVEASRFAAQLAGCDGSIVVSSDLRILGFGAEIRAEFDSDMEVLDVVHELRRKYTKCDIEQFGMRHRSAIKLASRVANCPIFVVSQDGPISLVWSEAKKVFVKKNVPLTNMNMPWA